MKSLLFIIPLILLSSFLFAQDEKTNQGYVKERSDSVSARILKEQLPPRTLIIKLKDIKEIENLKEKPFIIVDDTASYTRDELSSGLTEEELERYKMNKETLIKLLTPPPSEEKSYPAVSTMRKILGIAKTAAVIVILIMSLL